MTSRDTLLALLGTWSRPPDLPATLAAGVAALFGIAVLFGRGRSLLFGASGGATLEEIQEERRRFLAIAGMIAGLLSIAYVAIYLRGGPRIVDATTYFLQGRALAQGDYSWATLDPSASFRGRFLLYRHTAEGASLGGIFPPGFPLLLALGFKLNAPMVVGPAIAIALVAATYRLARTLAEDVAPELAEPIARTAALLSVVCAALRYHTADTMSHGASALGVTLALTFALGARKALRTDDLRCARLGPGLGPAPGLFSSTRAARDALFAGLAMGFVGATRPVSAVPIALVVAWLLLPFAFSSRHKRTVLLPSLVGVLPGVLLLLLSQRAVTGAWLESTQRVYYAIADGPERCFRWGFGANVGCLFEHGEFVHARLEHGYGLVEAAGATLRRLHKHLLDVANFELLALLVLLPAPLALLRRRSASAVTAATVLVGLQVLAYAPFYFDGNYPGGGARFFADVLPVEHALVALGVGALASFAAAQGSAFLRGAMAVLALACAGFAVHGVNEHVMLRDRDGGRPMFEPDVLARASVSKGLVFVETDHGFSLGHDPSARPENGVVVARRRNDDRDRMLYDALGRPPTWLYKFEPNAVPTSPSAPTLAPWSPPASGATLRFEAEAEWPVLSQAGGFAAPAWTNACASGSRALVLTPDADRDARATITVPVPSEGRWIVDVHLAHDARAPFAPVVPARETRSADGAVVIGPERWTWKGASGCETLAAKTIDLSPPYALVEIEARGGPVAIDSLTLRRAP